MKISYDPEVGALHILFAETTVTMEELMEELAEGIAADYDAQGRLAGIEIRDAAQRMGGHDGLRQITVDGIGQAVAV